jgi:NAD(P)-dependent dehydrogenase (short-subunit alcohol dehydrogenase family)
MKSNHTKDLTIANDLAAKVIFITGASKGIGNAVATECALAGATVIACGRDVNSLEKLSDSIVREGGRTPSLLPINLANANIQDYKKVASHIREQFGKLDGLILNAAMLGELTPLNNYANALWREVFQVNVHSNLLMLQEFRQLLIGSELKSVIFTLESEQVSKAAHWGAYGSSKAALRSVMRMLAAENSAIDQINVIGVIPPPTKTDIRTTAYPAEDQTSLANPHEIAKDYVKLLTLHNKNSHGQIFKIKRQSLIA